MKGKSESLKGLVSQLSDLARRQQKIEDEAQDLKKLIRDRLSLVAFDNPDPPEFDLPNYTFQFETIFDPEPHSQSWSGRLSDSGRYIICEVYNNGEGGGNFYIWHNEEAKWGIEAEAKREFPEIGLHRSGHSEPTDIPALDAWLFRVISKTENSWE